MFRPTRASFFGDDWNAEFLSYEVPTYFGMLTASFTRKD